MFLIFDTWQASDHIPFEGIAMKFKTRFRVALAAISTRTVAAQFLIALCVPCLPCAASAEQARSDKLVRISEGVSLRVVEAGPPQAQTVVLVPGWCFTADIWAKQIAYLSEHYHVVAFDPRSQGRSTILNHSNSPDDRGEDIANLIKELHLKKPVIVGWSQGVQDVAAYVLKSGAGEIGGIVLVDAQVSAGAAGIDPRAAAEELGRMQVYVRAQRQYLEAMMPYIFKQPLSPNELNTIVSAAMQTPSSVGVANLVLDQFSKDYRPSIKRMDAPTLIIIAGTAGDRNEQAQQPIAKASKAVVEGAGHAVFYDQPAKFNALLVEFLEKSVKVASPAA